MIVNGRRGRFARGGVAALLWMMTASAAAPATTIAATDAPGTCAGATTTSPKGAWIAETISTSTDVDWFRFTTTSTARTLVTLGHLPADYDLYLYAGCTKLIASSHLSGTRYDEINWNLGAGTFSVKVVGYAGAHSTSTYALRFRPLPAGIPILSSLTWTDSVGYLHVIGEVLNNTTDYRRWVEIDATLLAASGAAVGSAVGYTDVPTLRPSGRSTFEIVARQPTGYAKTSLKVCTPNIGGSGCLSGQPTTDAPMSAAVAPSPTYLDAAGLRHYPGTVTNTATATEKLARALVTLHDSYGNIRGLGGAPTSPTTIPVGGSASFDVRGSGTTTPNRVAYAVAAGPTGCSTSPRYATSGQENFKPPLTRASASGRVALTFDMGGRMTPAVKILNTLVANRICATIFPTGRISQTTEGQAALVVVKAHPDLFELGNHTMHHCDLVRGGGGSPSASDATFCAGLAPSPTQAEVQKELTDAGAIITATTGMATKPFWRAPYGAYNSSVLTWAAQAGWTKQWNFDIDTIDWKPIADGGPTARSITLKVVNNAKAGSVVLMHLGGYETLDSLQATIDGLRSRGFVLTTLSDLAG